MEIYDNNYDNSFYRVKRKIVDNIVLITVAVVGFAFISYLVVKKFQGQRIINKEYGYVITGPVKWKSLVSDDDKTVIFTKKPGSHVRNAKIKLEVDIGNPYGRTPLDYVNNGLIPQIEYSYDKDSISYRTYPFIQMRNGIEWATLSFFINYVDLQVLYVTMVGDYVFVMALQSSADHEEDEAIFYRTLDTLIIHEKDRRNFFSNEPTDELFQP